MKMLATLIGGVTVIALLSACAYHPFDRYAYGYGYGYGNPYGTYGESYWNARGCWLDSVNAVHCVR
jgi:hypothetical protein